MKKVFLPTQHEEIGYEAVWVKELSPNTGEIDNLPVFAREYKFRDIIEYDPGTSTAIRIVNDGGYTPTEIIRYSGKFQDEKVRREAEGYCIEGWQPGIMAITKRCDRR
jgi:hypothetical protein